MEAGVELEHVPSQAAFFGDEKLSPVSRHQQPTDRRHRQQACGFYGIFFCGTAFHFAKSRCLSGTSFPAVGTRSFLAVFAYRRRYMPKSRYHIIMTATASGTARG
ncbi:MAG: hypothetical protein H5T73_03085 [Actinobacteria bacterium]|nr:hypothetical protein [Actinomycetota bacterium]